MFSLIQGPQAAPVPSERAGREGMDLGRGSPLPGVPIALEFSPLEAREFRDDFARLAVR
jgi:hypothetical protein